MIPQTRFEQTRFESDIVYPFEPGNRDKYPFKRVRVFTKEELTQLIGSLRIANKYLVMIHYLLLYQHDEITYLCEEI